MSIAHGVTRLFAGRRGAGEQLNARRPSRAQKTCSAKHANDDELKTKYMVIINNVPSKVECMYVATGTTYIHLCSPIFEIKHLKPFTAADFLD